MFCRNDEVLNGIHLNPRVMMEKLDSYISHMQNRLAKKPQIISPLKDILSFRAAVLQARCGQLFKEVAAAWLLEFTEKLRYVEYNHKAAISRMKFYSTLSISSAPPPSSLPLLKEICQFVKKLVRQYGDVKLYPLLWHENISMPLFNPDCSINTDWAIKLYDYAQSVAMIAAEERLGGTLKAGELNPVTQDDIFDVLKEIIEPILFKLNIEDDFVFYEIFKNCHDWNAMNDLEQRYNSVDLNTQHFKCASIQNAIINTIDLLRMHKITLLPNLISNPLRVNH